MSVMFAGAPAGGEPWIRNPSSFGKMGTEGVNNPGIKSAATTLASFSTAGILLSMAQMQGAAATLALDNTFVTVCDIVGGGICSGVIGGAKDTAGASISTIEMTVDGNIYTFTAALTGSSMYKRQALGLFVAHSLVNANGGGVNGGVDYGIDLNYSAPAVVGHALVWPQEARALGLAALKFDTGLKVRMKMSALGSGDFNRDVGVFYQLDA